MDRVTRSSMGATSWLAQLGPTSIFPRVARMLLFPFRTSIVASTAITARQSAATRFASRRLLIPQHARRGILTNRRPNACPDRGISVVPARERDVAKLANGSACSLTPVPSIAAMGAQRQHAFFATAMHEPPSLFKRSRNEACSWFDDWASYDNECGLFKQYIPATASVFLGLDQVGSRQA